MLKKIITKITTKKKNRKNINYLRSNKFLEEVNKKWHFRIPTENGKKIVPLFIQSIDLGYNFLDDIQWKLFVNKFREVLRTVYQNIKNHL